jgi:pyruvate dehydrogenase E2 component (dihydrolipoamide acetyltransferase)
VEGKLPWDALFIKLLGLALRDHPELNATVEDDALLFWQDINIGFAVAVSGGLQVPVVHNADTKTLVAITSAVMELGRRAVDGSLQPEEVLGGTATITNLGGFGVDAFTPVLNPPQSVILGIGRIMERPVVESGVIVPAKTCVLSLTFDHRVADGVPAAQLLEHLSTTMTDEPFLMALR